MTHTPGEAVVPLASGENPPVPGAVKVSVLADGTARHHSARTKARKAALDVLFEADLRERDLADVLDERETTIGPVREFTRQIVLGVRHHGAAIDQRLAESCSADWTPERMPRIDRAIARIAIWELDHSQAPTDAILSEAIELTDEYSGDESVAYLNGLLATAARTRAAAGEH